MAEVSKIRNIEEMLVPVNDGWQSEPTDEPTSGWRQLSVVEVAVLLVADV